jgi:pimeloyl-ACP methyl ester carboxylesterase
MLQERLSRSFVEMAHSPHSDPALKARAYELSSSNDMAVCRLYYTQCKWADKVDWAALTTIPTLVCQGVDDKITSLEGAKELVDFISSHSFQRTEEVGYNIAAKKSELDQSAVTILVGSKDSPQPSPRLAEKYPRIILKEVQKAGHQVMQEQPQEVVALISDFLATECGFSSFAAVQTTDT